MASRNTTQAEKQALIDRLESSREQLSQDIDAVAAAVDIPARIRSRFAASPLKIAAGAAIAGLAGSALLRHPLRTAKTVSRFGSLRRLAGPIAMFGLDLLRRRTLRTSQPSPASSPAEPSPAAPRSPEPLVEKVAKAFWQALK